MKGMRVICLCVVLLSVTLSLSAQIPQWDWARSAGGPNDESGSSVAIDSQGNQYVTGFFYNTASFGAYTVTSSGYSDIFAAKLDPDGNWLWAVSAGGPYIGSEPTGDVGKGIAVDSAGNVFLTGYFFGTASFGLHTLTSSGSYDIFAARLNSGTPVDDELNPPAVTPVLSASPNPFSASTAIRVAGDKPEHLAGGSGVNIYDLRGQKVRFLAIESLSGIVSLDWDGRDDRGFLCPNGIYLVRLEMGGRIATLKLSLVK